MDLQDSQGGLLEGEEGIWRGKHQFLDYIALKRDPEGSHQIHA